MEKNKKVKNTKNKVDDFMSEKENRILVELREKWQLDYNSSIYAATKKVIHQGFKRGIQQGVKRGIEQDVKQGLEQGELKKQTDIAKKLITHNLDILAISEITGLTKEEILKLQN